jgi:hypothetical protein
VATQSCPGLQYWGRVFAKVGHEIRMLPGAIRETVSQGEQERLQRYAGELVRDVRPARNSNFAKANREKRKPWKRTGRNGTERSKNGTRRPAGRGDPHHELTPPRVHVTGRLVLIGEKRRQVGERIGRAAEPADLFSEPCLCQTEFAPKTRSGGRGFGANWAAGPSTTRVPPDWAQRRP